MLLIVVLASLFECMARIKIVNKSPNHLITYDLTFAAGGRATALNVQTVAPLSPCPLAVVLVVAMAITEDELLPTPPSTLRRMYHLPKSST